MAPSFYRWAHGDGPFLTELESEPGQNEGPSAISWTSSHKPFPTETTLLPQSTNPHCRTFLSLCQEITFYILQALDNSVL